MSLLPDFNQPDTPLISPVPQEIPESLQAVRPRMPWLTATRILISVNFLIFLAMFAHRAYVMGTEQFMNTRIGEKFDHDLLLRWGSDFGPVTLGGQYWRVITSLFLHLNFVHLTVNLLFLWGLGTLLDRLLGRTKTFAIYLLTGIAGSVASLSWHPTVNSVGSSGGIYGLAGVIITLLAFARLKLPRRNVIRILIWLILMTPFGLVFGHISKETNYAAHIGGLVSGIIIGGILAWTFRTPVAERAARQHRLLVFSAVALVVMFTGVAFGRRHVVKQYREELALDLLSIDRSQRIVSQNPNDAQAHANLGFAYLADANLDRAVAEYRRALEIKPGDPTYQGTLVSLYSILRRYGDAVPLYREILARGSATSDQYAGFATALMATNQLSEAEEAARKAVALDNKSRNSHQVLSDVLLKLGKTAEAERERKIAEQLPPAK